MHSNDNQNRDKIVGDYLRSLMIVGQLKNYSPDSAKELDDELSQQLAF